MPPGPFVIVLLPPVDGEPRYRVKSTIDGYQRVMLESQIRLMAEPETASVRLLLFMHTDDATTIRPGTIPPADRQSDRIESESVIREW